VRYRWEHGAREQWWLVGEDNSIGRPSHPEPPYTRYTISGRLVHHGQELTSLVEARSAAEDIADSCQQGTP